MNKYDEDIIKTLNILYILQKELDTENLFLEKPKLFLKINDSILSNQGIVLNDFIYSLNILAKEHYLGAVSFHNKKKEDEFKSFFTKEIKTRIKLNAEVYNNIDKINIKQWNKETPKLIHIDEKIFNKNNIDENVFIKSLGEVGENFKLDDNIKSYIILYSKNNIQKVLEKMKNNHSFKSLHRTWLLKNKSLEELLYKKLKHSVEKKYTYGDIIKYLLDNDKYEGYFYDNIKFNGKIPTNKQCYDSCVGFNKTLKTKKYFKKNFFEAELNRVRFNPELMNEIIK